MSGFTGIRRTGLALALALLAGTPAAAAFRTAEGYLVQPLGETRFQVPFQGAGGAPAFWCAAGRYARDALRAPVNARIWRETPVPRRSGQPMVFSMTPEGASGDTGVLSFGTDDGSFSVAMANNFCEPRLRRF